MSVGKALRHLPYLQKLTIQDQTLDTLAFLASLSNLKELNLIDCRFAANELDIIAGLPALERLTLANCSLSTISGLESAQNLTYLDLSNNTIRNLDPLSTLVNLQTLNLGHNAVVTLNALSGLVNLESLNICYNVISSIAPIATCHNLTDLTANNNQLVDRKGERFPVVQAPGCRNEILNSKKLFLADKAADYARLGLTSARLMFTTESAPECARVLERYLGRGNYTPNEYTRGLYYRDVE